jgi:hypothetical protein
MPQRKHTLTLTDREWGAVAEAVRYAQQAAEEGGGRLDPTLSRVQRKMNEPVGAE